MLSKFSVFCFLLTATASVISKADKMIAAVTSLLLLSSLTVNYVISSCHYIDGYWKVDYNRGLNKYDEDDLPEPPRVRQLGLGRLGVRWGELVMDPQCVDRSGVSITLSDI